MCFGIMGKILVFQCLAIFQMISALDEYLMLILFKENFFFDWKEEYHLNS